MVQLSGTEHRDQYRTFYDASVGSGSAQKASIAPGPEKTSTMIGLPWCNSSVPKEVPWSHKVWAPVGVAGNVHYRPTSSSIGSAAQKPYHMLPAFEKPKEAASVRYLQAPYLVGDMAQGAGIDARPVSSVSTFSLASNRQADILAGGEARLFDRMAQTTSFTASRSLRSAPVTAVPDAYLTSTNSSFRPRPMADSQQHRLRGFTTSAYVPERSLDSAPARCPTAPLDGATTLHATRFLGVRDSDGSRRLIEVDTTGAPAPTASWKLPTAPSEPPPEPNRLPFVASQPMTRSMDLAKEMADDAVNISTFSGFPGGTASREPRSPWPSNAAVTVKHRRPFAMGYEHGMPIWYEYKIFELQKAAAAEDAAAR